MREKGSEQRQLPLGQNGLRTLLSYLDQHRPDACGDHLFLSEVCRPLINNEISLLFGRLRQRAGILRKNVGPSLLRDTFVVRSVQAGGDLFSLRKLLGQEESVTVKRSLCMYDEGS